MQLLPSLLSELQAVWATFPDRRKGRGGNIAPTDFGLSAFAMFFMQSASFLAYQRTMEKGHGRSNCQTLFGIGRIPSDNYIRDFLDEAPRAPAALFRTHGGAAMQAADAAGLRPVGRKNPGAWDGTEFFCSQKLGCPHCPDAQALQRHAVGDGRGARPFQGRAADAGIHRAAGRRRQAGLRTQRGKALVRQARRAAGTVAPRVPGRRSVRLPTRRQNGDRRRRPFHLHLLAGFPQGAVRLHRRCRASPSRKESRPAEHERDIPLSLERGGSPARRQGCDPGHLDVNWMGFEIVDTKGKVKYSLAWATSIPVSKDNVAEIVACGRARWKIENESFNVLKNHGYELEHNFGHGQRFLAMTLAALNLLAFAWHTVLELLEPPWQAAREAAVKRT